MIKVGPISLGTLSLVTLLQFAAHPGYGVVDMKSFNYSNTWVDLQIPGTGYGIKVDRTYNSRTLFKGIFGFGWCSNFETTLAVTPEKNILITECGAGQEVMFYSRQLSKYAQQLGSPLQIKEGTQWQTLGGEVEIITFEKGAYIRNLPDGTSERFNSSGRLTHLYDKSGNELKFNYDKGLLKTVEDNKGRLLTFKYYNNNLVESITGPDSLMAQYKYKNSEDLVWVKNSWDNEYTYEYDDLHNMTKSVYPDGSSILLTYDKLKDWVLTFTDREKCLEVYKSEAAKDDPLNHYWSTVEKRCGDKVVANNRYEFVLINKCECPSNK